MKKHAMGLGMLAFVLCTMSACDEGEYRDASCTPEYVPNCLDERHFMSCGSDGWLNVIECGMGTTCRETVQGDSVSAACK